MTRTVTQTPAEIQTEPPPSRYGVMNIRPMKRETNTLPLDSISIHSDVLRLMYAGMLLALPNHLVRKFWSPYTLPSHCDKVDEADLFRFLLNNKGPIPLEYLINIFHDIEPFLLNHGICPLEFIKSTLQKIDSGMIISSRTVLSLAQPLLMALYEFDDLHTASLHLMNRATNLFCNGLQHRIIKLESNGTRNTALMLLMGALKTKQPTDGVGFHCSLPCFDAEIWTGMIVQLNPLSFNMPPYEELSMIADARSIEQVVTGMGKYPHAKHTSDIFKTVQFHEHCQSCGIEVNGLAIPDARVDIAQKDIFCKQRKRIVVHRGCSYNAPVWMYSLSYCNNLERPKDFLSKIISDAISGKREVWNEIRNQHNQLLETIIGQLQFTYNSPDETMTINGRHFVSGAPAKILRKMLQIMEATGNREFENRVFSKDQTISYDPLAPNFSVRLKRLAETFAKKCPNIQIKSSGRGKFKLVTDCKIVYSEKS